MNKVFRLYNEGDTSFQDWNETPVFPYNKGNRAEDKMPDPDGASAAHEITSIPSPFARIDLIKTAFAEVCSMCKKGNRTDVSKLDGDTIFHKMVSDSLDVGELFFNYSKLKDKLEIITWNPRAMLDEMDTSNDAGQQIYSQALRKYMLSDEKTYNFNLDLNFYLLNYINGPQQLNIIGATSTATLFFSTANKIDYIKDSSFAS